MKTILIDFRQIKSYEDFYALLHKKLALPSYFGHNLDALYDFLSGGVELPLKIEFKNCNAFKTRAFSRLIEVLETVDREVKEFEFNLYT